MLSINTSNQTNNVGDIINIFDIVNLGELLIISNIYISLLVTTHTSNLIIPDDGDNHAQSDLTYSNQGNTVAYINQIRGDQLGNVGMANDGDFNNPKIKLNTVGTYDLTVHTATFDDSVTVRINVQKKTYTLQYKTAPAPSLGSIGSQDDNTNVVLTFNKSDNSIENTFDVYDNNVKVTDSDLLTFVYERITELSFKLMKDNVPVKVGGTFEITESGSYQLDMFNFTSELLLIDFSKISFTIDDVSYSNVRFAEPVNITFGSTIPQIHSYLTIDTLSTLSPTRLTQSDISSYTVQLVNPSNSATINQQNIPVTEPGTYILKILFGSNTVTGLLNIGKAKINIKNTLNKFYKVSSGSLNLGELFYVETLNGIKKPNETLTFNVKFTSLSGAITISSLSTATSSVFNITENGTVEITVTYAGSDLYIPSTDYQTTTVGKIPLSMSVTSNFLMTSTELTSTKITQVESDIINSVNATNSITNESISSDLLSLLKTKLSIKYRQSSSESHCFELKYTLTENNVEGSINTVTVTDTFLNMADFIDPLENNTKTLSIKGIKVFDGSTLTLNYHKTVESVKTHSTITLVSNDNYYKIDNSTDTSVTYVNIVDNNNDTITLATSELTYVETSIIDYTNMANLRDDIYKVVLTVNDNNNDFSEYSITQQVNDNVVITSNLAITLDLLNYLADRINQNDREIDYLLEKPQLNYSISSSVDDYTISGSYLTASFTANQITTSIPSSFLTNMKVQPDFAYVADNLNNDSIDLPFTTSTHGLDVYNGTTKLNITSTFKVDVPNLTINNKQISLDTWLEDNSIVINDPTSIANVSVNDNISTLVQNIDSNMASIIPEFEQIENIVLDTNNTDPSRSFWVGLIDKLSVLRSKLETQIRADPGMFLFNDDIDDLNEYSGINVNLDLTTFDQADLNFLTNNSDIYSKLIRNEINTIILRKHILTSAVILKYNLLDKLTLNYTTGTKTFTASVSNGSVLINIPSFSGTFGEITMSMSVNITNTLSSFGTVNYLNPYRIVSYSVPSNGIGTYTNTNNTTSTVVINSTSSNINVGQYNINGSITLKGSDGLAISGLTRTKILEERTNRNKFISSATQEGISGTATITIEQLSRID